MVELPRSEPIRWLRRTAVAAVLVLLGEYLLLSWMFDATSLQRQIAWTSGLGYLAPLMIAIGTAVVVFTSTRSVNVSGSVVLEPRSVRRALPFIAAHALLFFAFLLLTRALFGGGRVLRGDPRAWFGAWVLLALAVVGALALGVISPRQLVTLVRRTWIGLLAGVLVGIAAWNAGRAAEYLWKPLGGLTVHSVAQVVSWLFPDPVSIPSRFLVGTSHFQVRVAPICSGFEGIGLMLVLQSAWLIALRRELRFPNALVLIPLGVAVAWVANVFRIVGLIAIGSRWSPSLALGGFHSKAGWVLFCGAALGLMILSRRSRFFSRSSPRVEELAETWHPTAAYLAPFLSGVAVQLVAGMLSIEADSLYPIQLLAILVPLWAYRRCYGDWRASWSWVVACIGTAAFAIDLGFGSLSAHSRASIFDRGVGLPSIAAGLLTIVVVPLAQELAFRGFLLRRLISADFTEVSPGRFSLPSFLISSVAFGVLQGNWIIGTISGMLFALAQYWRGRTADAFLAHALTSLFAVAYSLAAGA